MTCCDIYSHNVSVAAAAIGNLMLSRNGKLCKKSGLWPWPLTYGISSNKSSSSSSSSYTRKKAINLSCKQKVDIIALYVCNIKSQFIPFPMFYVVVGGVIWSVAVLRCCIDLSTRLRLVWSSDVRRGRLFSLCSRWQLLRHLLRYQLQVWLRLPVPAKSVQLNRTATWCKQNLRN